MLHAVDVGVLVYFGVVFRGTLVPRLRPVFGSWRGKGLQLQCTADRETIPSRAEGVSSTSSQLHWSKNDFQTRLRSCPTDFSCSCAAGHSWSGPYACSNCASIPRLRIISLSIYIFFSIAFGAVAAQRIAKMHVWVGAFSLLFAVVFWAAFRLWTKLFHGTEKHKLVAEFSSYLMAFFHGVSICGIAIWLLTADEEWHNFNSPNTRAQNIALCLSLGYFIAVSAAPIGLSLSLLILIMSTPRQLIFFANSSLLFCRIRSSICYHSATKWYSWCTTWALLSSLSLLSTSSAAALLVWSACFLGRWQILSTTFTIA